MCARRRDSRRCLGAGARLPIAVPNGSWSALGPHSSAGTAGSTVLLAYRDYVNHPSCAVSIMHITCSCCPTCGDVSESHKARRSTTVCPSAPRSAFTHRYNTNCTILPHCPLHYGCMYFLYTFFRPGRKREWRCLPPLPLAQIGEAQTGRLTGTARSLTSSRQHNHHIYRIHCWCSSCGSSSIVTVQDCSCDTPHQPSHRHQPSRAQH